MMFAFFAAPALAVYAPLTVAQNEPVAEGDKPISERAADLFAAIATGQIDRTLLTPGFSSLFNDAVLANDTSIVAGRGEPKRITLTAKNDTGSQTRYVFLVVWKDKNALSFTLGIDKAKNLVDALYFTPAQLPPS